MLIFIRNNERTTVVSLVAFSRIFESENGKIVFLGRQATENIVLDIGRSSELVLTDLRTAIEEEREAVLIDIKDDDTVLVEILETAIEL